MKRSFIYLSFILYTSCLFSCHRDKDTAGQSYQLAKVLIVDSANPAKSVRVYDFVYDNKNRVTEINYSAGDSVNGELKLTYYRSSKCSYNGSANTPYLTKGFGFPVGSPDAGVYHFYDNKDALLKDSMPDTRTSPVYYYYNMDYSYGNNYIMIKKTDAFSSVNTPAVYYDSLVISNHNITRKFSNYFPGNTNSIGYQYSYDNKINPLSRLNISSFLINNSVEYSITPGYCNNNVTKWDWGMFSNGQFTSYSVFDLSYRYNDKGLPVECKVSNAAPFPYFIKYYYK